MMKTRLEYCVGILVVITCAATYTSTCPTHTFKMGSICKPCRGVCPYPLGRASGNDWSACLQLCSELYIIYKRNKLKSTHTTRFLPTTTKFIIAIYPTAITTSTTPVTNTTAAAATTTAAASTAGLDESISSSPTSSRVYTTHSTNIMVIVLLSISLVIISGLVVGLVYLIYKKPYWIHRHTGVAAAQRYRPDRRDDESSCTNPLTEEGTEIDTSTPTDTIVNIDDGDIVNPDNFGTASSNNSLGAVVTCSVTDVHVITEDVLYDDVPLLPGKRSLLRRQFSDPSGHHYEISRANNEPNLVTSQIPRRPQYGRQSSCPSTSGTGNVNQALRMCTDVTHNSRVVTGRGSFDNVLMVKTQLLK